ncbi:hypothetical protein LARV_00967 [Longilinea arvoryzae]|uniref:Uncharacterized protein n=1 Tax=Longilinea arvoryzae TaxID=360412 RepID=A0A0S7BE79_9CHLR|nr:hypothetical protein [Longilinea arvoryzae]GAP13216.1 hypothetical protein LARV_00967 [Longilinea arvoryzae]
MKYLSAWMGTRHAKWRLIVATSLFLAFLLCGVRIASAAISPEYLRNGRTYDQESSFIQWTGTVAYVNLFHRDNTSLPPSEGGASCVSGCTEQVTRIQDGSSVSGNFTYLSTFNIQAANSGDTQVGRVIVQACGQIIYSEDLYAPNQSVPGFVNLPVPAWNVPTAGDCVWSISASGGYVDVRAVTTVYRTTSVPTVDLKVNNSNGPLNLVGPASYNLTWTSTDAASCSASNSWSGAQATNGSQVFSGITSGSYTYTITCTNPAGSAEDSITVNVLSAPTVTVSVPASLTEPASFMATWTSSNAVSCTGSNRFSGLSGLTGSRAEVSLPAGMYDYSVTCTNAAGATASDTKRTFVYAAPVVDVKLDGMDGPEVTIPGPASYTVTWTSANAVQCNGSSRLAGSSGLSGSRAEVNVPSGTAYEYTVVCTNALGAAARDSIRVYVLTPLSGTISAAHPRLLLFASNLAQPAQTLIGTASGGTPVYTTIIHVRAPSGLETLYPQSGSAWTITPLSVNDPNFGTAEEGTWTAWGVITDAAGAMYRTASVSWDVAWYPVHGRP